MSSIDNRISELVVRLAGDKIAKVLETTTKLIDDEGKTWGRALADALELHRCPTNVHQLQQAERKAKDAKLKEKFQRNETVAGLN